MAVGAISPCSWGYFPLWLLIKVVLDWVSFCFLPGFFNSLGCFIIYFCSQRWLHLFQILYCTQISIAVWSLIKLINRERLSRYPVSTISYLPPMLLSDLGGPRWRSANLLWLVEEELVLGPLSLYLSYHLLESKIWHDILLIFCMFWKPHPTAGTRETSRMQPRFCRVRSSAGGILPSTSRWEGGLCPGSGTSCDVEAGWDPPVTNSLV